MAEQQSDEKEREEYGKKRVWTDCKHGRWLSPCPICKNEGILSDREKSGKFKREHFTRIDLDQDHYYYRFGVPGFEICLEPCAGGFDVVVYDNGVKVEPGVCTNSDGYLNSAAALFGDRTDEDWNKALTIADGLLDKYMKNNTSGPLSYTLSMEKLGEMLVQKEKDACAGMKCMFCGCTDNNACPGGCSWVELKHTSDLTRKL